MKKENDNRVATRGQRRKIRGMLDGDWISFELAQAIIEGNVKVMDDYDRGYAFFENNYPGKGRVLMEIYEPIQNIELSLRPALIDLPDRGQDVVFWRENTKIKIVLFREIGQIQTLVKASLEESLKEVFDYLDKVTGVGLPRSDYQSALKVSLWDMIPTVKDEVYGNAFWVMAIESNWELFSRALMTSLNVPLQLVLANKSQEARRFKPLYDLWLAGNYPLGFDRDGKLVVLVAD